MSSDNIECEPKTDPSADQITENEVKPETDVIVESVSEKVDQPEETPQVVENGSVKETDETEPVDEKSNEKVEDVEEKCNTTIEETSSPFTDEKPEDISLSSEPDNSIGQSLDISQEIISSPTVDNANTDEIKLEKKSDSPEPLSNGDIKIQTGKEDEKNNVLSDDLIFVKPKDKDRGHCYWYGTFHIY